MNSNRRTFIKTAVTVLLNMEFLRRSALAKNVNLLATPVAQDMNSPLAKVTIHPERATELAALLESFANPPLSDMPGGYWWWFNTLMNKQGITRDLEEFKAKGLGEVLLVNSQAGLGGNPLPDGPRFLSAGWFELYRFALQEAHRLGITVGFNLCAGWCMGGPWIKPEESGRWYLQSQIEVTGPTKVSEQLPLPGNRDGYNDVKNPPGVKDYIDLPLEKLDYRDTAVIAIRKSDVGSARIDGARGKLLPAKSNRMDASNWTRASIIMEKPLETWASEATDAPVALETIVILTDKMGPDGLLNWDVPAGNWIIIRTGHRMTGSKTMLALPGTEGLSIDWLHRDGMESQWKHLGEPILAASKPYVGNTLAYFCDDSFEDGFPNWTQNILEQFQKYRGYDATPYLAVLAGYIVGSAEISDRFLHDYRKTVADLLADEHYGRFAELCHGNNLLVQNESAGPSRSGTMCMDALKNLGRSDMPMGEFWLGKNYGEPDEEDLKLGYGTTRLEDGQNKVTKMVASGAHIYGKKLVAAESFTSFRPHWVDYPHTLRYAADRAFCEGVNRIMIHTTTGSRPEDGKPGYEYGAGTHYNPNVTWWNQSGAFNTYLARCQHLLRQGLFVADVLYYNGDWAPNLVPAKHTHPGLGKGYDYDVCNEEVLLTRLVAKDGRIMLPDGMSYRVLVLPETYKMPVSVLKMLLKLVDHGAIIIGPKPSMDPGLKDFPECDREVTQLANQLWGDCDGKVVTSHAYGNGKVYWGITEREVLAKLEVAPDFEVTEDAAYVDFIHRESNGADIYFVLNRKKEKQMLTCKFRVGTRQAHLFDPVSGKARRLPDFTADSKHTSIKLEFEPRESYFIVFPKSAATITEDETAPLKNFAQYQPVHTIDGDWTVTFDPNWGGPASAEFSTLSDWAKHADKRIQHYSGTATYRIAFDLPTNFETGDPLFLDLGTVHNIADVRLNGKRLGTVWTNPWRIEAGGDLRVADNRLEIDVTNLWPNRLIGDAALPVEQRLTHTNIEFKSDAALLPSGLLGPVTLQRKL